MTADTDQTSLIRQPVQVTADDTEHSAQQQSVITSYSDVSAIDLNVPKTAEADNNNENVAEENSV